MNANKPVAWILKTGQGTKIVEEKPHCEVDLWEPLYTHPVKELTDGEIQEISHQYHYTYNPDYVGFARAILKRAQDK